MQGSEEFCVFGKFKRKAQPGMTMPSLSAGTAQGAEFELLEDAVGMNNEG
jgi:hypothetical protein